MNDPSFFDQVRALAYLMRHAEYIAFKVKGETQQKINPVLYEMIADALEKFADGEKIQ